MIRGKTVLISVLFTLICNALLFATWYQSNNLGQQLQVIDEREREQFTFTLKLEGDEASTTSTLYYNTVPVSKEVKTVSDGTTQIIQTLFENGVINKKTTKIYKEGLLQQTTIEEDEHTIDYIYTYENNQLIEEKKIVDNQLQSLTTFYRFYDGSLAGTRVINKENGTVVTLYDSDGDVSNLISDADNKITLYSIYSNGVIDDSEPLTSDAFYDEEGNLQITENIDGETKISRYSPKGKLLEVQQLYKNGESETRSYEYDKEGNLIHATQIITNDEVKRIERWYTIGLLKNQTEWIDEVPVRAVKYLDNGTSIVTIFENGRPYTDVTYASDGKRVLSIEYRKEQ